MVRFAKALGLVAVGAGMLLLVGCSSDTDVTKDVNDAYHNRQGGAPPPAGAMKPKGAAFVGKPTSIPTAGGGPPGGGGPPPAAMRGPGG